MIVFCVFICLGGDIVWLYNLDDSRELVLGVILVELLEDFSSRIFRLDLGLKILFEYFAEEDGRRGKAVGKSVVFWILDFYGGWGGILAILGGEGGGGIRGLRGFRVFG